MIFGTFLALSLCNPAAGLHSAGVVATPSSQVERSGVAMEKPSDPEKAVESEYKMFKAKGTREAPELFISRHPVPRLAEHARGRGITPSLHPHVGTLVETSADVRRVLEGTSVPLCLDTGHLLIGGTDPAALARAWASRMPHY